MGMERSPQTRSPEGGNWQRVSGLGALAGQELAFPQSLLPYFFLSSLHLVPDAPTMLPGLPYSLFLFPARPHGSSPATTLHFSASCFPWLSTASVALLAVSIYNTESSLLNRLGGTGIPFIHEVTSLVSQTGSD